MRGSRSTCSTRPGMPTSPGTCGRACGPRTRHCSPTRRPRASTGSPGCSGRNAPPSACHALSDCRAAFGDSVAPLYLPVSDAKGEVSGLIGLLSGRLFDYTDGARTESDPDPADADRVAELRGSLIEGIIQESEDESLMDAYLGGEEIDVKGLIEDLEKAVARG